MLKKRYDIVVEDKNKKFPFLLKVLRKRRYSVIRTESLKQFSLEELKGFDLLVVLVAYEFSELYSLSLISKEVPIIIASENSKILNKVRVFDCFLLVDLSEKCNVDLFFIQEINA